jgi:hypothetical protein
VPALAIENGPGPQVGSSVVAGRVRWCSTIRSARWSHSLSSFRRQTTMQRRPPGTSALRTLRRAVTGLAKNIVPKREKA